MANVVIDKPYEPVPPHRGRLWPWILGHYAPRALRKSYGISKVECLHVERLTESLKAGYGIMLAPNHCRDEDPIILGMLSRQAGSPFFIIASWHLFMQSRLRRFILQKAGAFSIYREGVDRTAINTSVEILEKAERPLVIFPEGHISRTNDYLNALMDGTSLIARSAAKRRAKNTPPGKLVVHPVAIRYQFQGDVGPVVSKMLDDIEMRLSRRPQRDLPVVDRIYKVGAALLSLKEIEYLDEPQVGSLEKRLKGLIDSILNPLEDQWNKGDHDGTVFARVKKLRTAILPDMVNEKVDDADRQRRWRMLDDLYLCQQLCHYPSNYVRANPTPHRLLETIERFEEDLTGEVSLHGEIKATVTVGTAIEVSPTRESRGEEDPLMEEIESQLRTMLGLSKGD